MSEPWTLAFGRYLRTLRERRGLSLHAVSSLSQPFAETVNKGYLSRCENGKQRIALSKIVPLSRLYNVSGDVLLERIELDMELDRVGGPDTEGLSFVELREGGREALRQGAHWAVYGYFRDALVLSASDGLCPEYSDHDEQVACSYISFGSACFGLGKRRLALHEFEYVEQIASLGPRYTPLLLERLAVTHRQLGNVDRARECADLAIAEANTPDGRQYLGYAYSTRALLAYYESDLELAAAHLEKGYHLFKESGVTAECARSLANLAQIFFDLGRYGAARRALMAGEKFVESSDQTRTRALSRILLGEIDLLENRAELAERRWKEAVVIAKNLNDKTLRFKAEYQLLRLAHLNNNEAVFRSIHRRLSRLSKYVPSNTPELGDFERLIAETTQ